LDWIDAPHTQNFEILESLEQTQESKKFEISFEFFVKMLDGLNFCKMSFRMLYLELFSESEIFEIFSRKF
jgi:hypothetical protein